MGDEKYFYTFCDLCSGFPTCGIRFLVKNGFVVRVEGWPGFPLSPICLKARVLPEIVHHPDRLLYPIMRTRSKDSQDPGWVRVSWDEAYKIIVSRLREIRDKYGPESIVFYVGNPKEPRAAVQRLCYTFGSPNYATESSVCRRAAEIAELLTFGFRTLGSMPSNETKLCVIWGSNPAWSRPPSMMIRLIEAKRRGVKFMVVDPRRTVTVKRLADLHLQIRPATDGALALAIINVMVEENLYNESFVERWVYGFRELAEYARNFTPEEAEKITWVPAEKIIEAAHMISKNSPATFLLSPESTTHNRNAVQNHRAILALIALTGCIDVPGGVTVPTHELLPGWDTGDPIFCMRNTLFPKIAEKRIDAEYFPVWARYIHEIQINLLPEYIKSGKVKAILMWGGNLMMWPQTHEYQGAIKKLEFAVAIDQFYRPWTHNYVDIVLPAATCLERKAPFAFFGRRIYGRRVMKPLGECKEDWQIAFDIGVRLGYEQEFWNGSVEDGLNSILSRFGLSLRDLEENLEKGVSVPAPGEEIYRKYEVGMLRSDGKPGFPTPTGKIEVYSTVLKEYGFDPLPKFRMPMNTTPEYPLILITGCRVPFYVHSRYREVKRLRRLMPDPVVNINPEDAEKRGVSEGDDVIVVSPWGRVRVKAHVTEAMPPGVVEVLHGWAEANVNELIPRDWDPISGFPPYNECICEVKRISIT